ncbi:MAG: radical SAM protein [Planctomycetota bacterium]|jgi:wyosine [tRNA(Phe)-imidazoG37] synthetase (radical SAM superfamily)
MDKTDAKRTGYIYGPVPSRRLGLSLGIDIVPAKICTLDCVYCQIGRTTVKNTVRRDFFEVQAVLSELKVILGRGVDADFITIGGSGEPTLNAQLGELIDGIRELTDIPVAIITNGTLLYRPDVRAECAKADLVMPSLDASDEAIFETVNRPAADISIEKLISGLVQFREEFAGQIWLEVFLIEGVNTGAEQIGRLRGHIERIRPDKVQLNSAARPVAEEGIKAMSPVQLEAIARRIDGNCEIVRAASGIHTDSHVQRTCEDVLSMLKRRPCSVDDICAGLGINRHEAGKHVGYLLEQGRITSECREGVTYYRNHSD